ncbi:MAG: hypothetical protein AB1489_15240 [Acidobacteriota bacterium]
MFKHLLFLLLLMVVIFSVGDAHTPRELVKFTTVRNFVLEPYSTTVLPAGQYIIREVDMETPYLLVLETKDREFLAILNVIPLYQTSKKAMKQSRAEFVWDFETSFYPVMKKIYLPNGEGFEILRVGYNEKSGKFVHTSHHRL